MSNLTRQEETEIQELITKLVEPQFSTIIEKLNEYLRAKNLRVGASVNWVYDKIDTSDKKD